MKEHYIARTLAGLTGVWLLIYCGWLRTQKAMLAADGHMMTNIAVFVACALVGVYLLAMVIRPQFAPSNRWLLAIVGIAVIIGAEAWLQDTPEKFVYIQDVMKIVGAALVITWPMKLLNTKAAEEKKFMEQVEIIEV